MLGFRSVKSHCRQVGVGANQRRKEPLGFWEPRCCYSVHIVKLPFKAFAAQHVFFFSFKLFPFSAEPCWGGWHFVPPGRPLILTLAQGAAPPPPPLAVAPPAHPAPAPPSAARQRHSPNHVNNQIAHHKEGTQNKAVFVPEQQRILMLHCC